MQTGGRYWSTSNATFAGSGPDSRRHSTVHVLLYTGQAADPYLAAGGVICQFGSESAEAHVHIRVAKVPNERRLHDSAENKHQMTAQSTVQQLFTMLIEIQQSRDPSALLRTRHKDKTGPDPKPVNNSQTWHSLS